MLEHADPFVPMTEASENFAGVTQYEALQAARRNTVDTLADQLIADNLTAFQVLAE